MIKNFNSSCRADCYNYVYKEIYAWIEIPEIIPIENYKMFLTDLSPYLSSYCDNNSSIDIIDDSIIRTMIENVLKKY